MKRTRFVLQALKLIVLALLVVGCCPKTKKEIVVLPPPADCLATLTPPAEGVWTVTKGSDGGPCPATWEACLTSEDAAALARELEDRRSFDRDVLTLCRKAPAAPTP